MYDPLARLRAELDQAREGAREYVGTLWAFYSAAVEEALCAGCHCRVHRGEVI